MSPYLLWKLFQKLWYLKNIDQINTAGHVLNVYVLVFIFFKEGPNK